MMNVANMMADQLAKVPPDHWVAMTLDESEIICFAPSLREAVAAAAERGVTDPLMLKTPHEWDFLLM